MIANFIDFKGREVVSAVFDGLFNIAGIFKPYPPKNDVNMRDVQEQLRKLSSEQK